MSYPEEVGSCVMCCLCVFLFEGGESHSGPVEALERGQASGKELVHMFPTSPHHSPLI